VVELPVLRGLHAEFTAPGSMTVLAIAMPYDPPLHVAQFAAQHRLPYPVALDVRGEAVRAFGGVPHIPATFLLDRDGRIVYSHIGVLEGARVRHAIESELPRS
jgi:peroxiredoxin